MLIDGLVLRHYDTSIVAGSCTELANQYHHWFRWSWPGTIWNQICEFVPQIFNRPNLCVAFRVWIPSLGALKIITSVSLTHIPCLFACFYESMSCVYVFFSTCRSTCVGRSACFVFCSIFIITSLLSCSFFYKINRHLCHGAYWCMHKPAHMSAILHLHLPFSNSRACVSKHVYAFPSSSIFIHTYRHIHMCG